MFVYNISQSEHIFFLKIQEVIIMKIVNVKKIHKNNKHISYIDIDNNIIL